MDTLAQAAPLLQTLDMPVVLDRFALTPAATPADDPRLQRLQDLLRTGQAYIKLSSPYRIGGTAVEAQRLARLFI